MLAQGVGRKGGSETGGLSFAQQKFSRPLRPMVCASKDSEGQGASKGYQSQRGDDDKRACYAKRATVMQGFE